MLNVNIYMSRQEMLMERPPKNWECVDYSSAIAHKHVGVVLLSDDEVMDFSCHKLLSTPQARESRLRYQIDRMARDVKNEERKFYSFARPRGMILQVGDLVWCKCRTQTNLVLGIVINLDEYPEYHHINFDNLPPVTAHSVRWNTAYSSIIKRLVQEVFKVPELTVRQRRAAALADLDEQDGLFLAASHLSVKEALQILKDDIAADDSELKETIAKHKEHLAQLRASLEELNHYTGRIASSCNVLEQASDLQLAKTHAKDIQRDLRKTRAAIKLSGARLASTQTTLNRYLYQ